MDARTNRMTDATRLNQVGGDHYRSLGIHVDEFAILNRWDADAFSCLKYLTRWFKSGKPLQDLQKAKTFAQRRFELIPGEWAPLVVGMSAMTYCSKNGLVGKTAVAVMALESMVIHNHQGTQANLVERIDALIREAEEQAKSTAS